MALWTVGRGTGKVGEGRGRSLQVSLSPPRESCLSPPHSIFRRPRSGPSESLQTVGEDGGTALGAGFCRGRLEGARPRGVAHREGRRGRPG